jgi:hypothetical protein
VVVEAREATQHKARLQLGELTPPLVVTVPAGAGLRAPPRPPAVQINRDLWRTAGPL